MFRPPPLGEPDTTGDLTRFPIPRLLFFLLKKAFLGTVRITSPDLSGHVYFRDGMPIFTDMVSTRDVLGNVLLERGAIDQPTYNLSLKELARTRQLHGQILLRMGAIDRRRLVEGLRVQLYRKLNRLFPLAEAQVAIFSGEHGVGRQGEGALVQADPLRVIYHGVRNCFDAARMEPELDKLQGQLMQLRSGFERRQARYGMTEEEQALASYLGRQPCSVEDLLRTSHLPPLQTLMLVYTLRVTEALHTVAAGTCAVRPAPPRPHEPPPPVVAGLAAPAEPPPLVASPPSPVTTRPTARPAEPSPPAVVPPPSGTRPAEPSSPAVVPPLPADVPAVEVLARSFSTDLLRAVPAAGKPPEPEIRPISLSQELPAVPPVTPRTVPEVGWYSAAGGLEPIPIEPEEGRSPYPGAEPSLVLPPPAELRPLVTPPPEEVSPLITPPPAEVSPLITPPPEEVSSLITPSPEELRPLSSQEVAAILDPAQGDETSAAAPPPAAPASSPSPPLPRAVAAPQLPPEPAPDRASGGQAAPGALPSAANERAKRSSQPPSPEAVREHRDLLRQAHERLASQDHFQVLELGREATADEVRGAYLRLAKLYHPDRCAALGLVELSPIAEEIFRRVNEAHAVLTDPVARQRYEEQLDGGGGRKEAMQALAAEFAFQKGLVFFRKKSFAEAQRCFEEAWRLNDKEGEHLAWLAWARFQDPRVDNSTVLPQIRDQLLTAVRISPQNATCHYYLGEVYLALSDEQRARACFTRTVELQESHIEANRHLRLMQMRKERKEKKDRGLFGGLLKKK